MFSSDEKKKTLTEKKKGARGPHLAGDGSFFVY